MFRKALITAAATTTLILSAAGVSNAQNDGQPIYGQQNYGQQNGGYSQQYNAQAQQGQQPQQANLSEQILRGARAGRGQYFQFALAPTFNANDESTNAVIISSTQLCAAYGLFGWTGMQGMTTPDAFAQMFLKNMQFQNLRVIGGQSVAPTQGFGAAKYYEFTYTSGQNPCHGACVVNVSSGYGSGNGAVRFAAARVDRWDEMKPALFKLAMSVGACGANTFGAQDTFAATRPRGNYGIGDWKPTSGVSAGVERAWRDGSDVMRGQETVNDGRGTTYQPTWDQYNTDRGGYVDPNRPDQVLQSGAAGENQE